MEKIIRMFNEFWKDQAILFFDKHLSRFIIQYNSGHCVMFEYVKPHNMVYALFFNPEYKFFEAMKWKERGDVYSMISADWNGKEMIVKEECYKAKFHTMMCAGKTAEEIIKYIEENTDG